jgi:hypothetical protein
MPLSDPRRRELEACLQDIQTQKPIDNAQIERALVALLDTFLEDGAAPDTSPATGSR